MMVPFGQVACSLGTDRKEAADQQCSDGLPRGPQVPRFWNTHLKTAIPAVDCLVVLYCDKFAWLAPQGGKKKLLPEADDVGRLP